MTPVTTPELTVTSTVNPVPDPPEVVAHLPILCNEMNIPFVFVPQKELLGQAISIDIGAAVACIVEPGDAKATLDKIIDSLNNLKG